MFEGVMKSLREQTKKLAESIDDMRNKDNRESRENSTTGNREKKNLTTTKIHIRQNWLKWIS
jgi:hypothetical protein